MSLIYGVFDKHEQPVPESWLQSMKQAMVTWPADQEDLHISGNVGLGRQLRFNTPESRSPWVQSPNGCDTVIMFDGRLDNRRDISAALGLPPNEFDGQCDDRIVMAAFERWGHDCCQHLLGDFAFAIWNGYTKELFFGRDHLGMRPLFVSETSRYFAFASNKRALLTLPWVDQNTNRQWIADLLSLGNADKQQSCIQGIESFPPAHQMLVSRGASSSANCYWSLDSTAELTLENDQAYVEQFRELLQEAVSCRLRSDFQISSELSGGLDSTTVASFANSLLRAQNQSPLTAYSHVLAEDDENVFWPYVDEKSWITELCDFADIQDRVNLTGRDVSYVNRLQLYADIHCGPSRGDLTLFSDELLDVMNQRDSRVLLSGFGGDQLVTSHGRGYVEEFGRNGEYRRLRNEQRAAGHTAIRQTTCCLQWWLRSTIPGMETALARRQHRIQSQQNTWDSHLKTLFVNRHFAEQFGYPDRFNDHPILAPNGTVRQREHSQTTAPVVSHRIEDSAVGAEAAGVEYRYPLLDVRLLEFCLAMPAIQKRRDGVRRRMIRMATEGILPERLRWRSDKSKATVPTVQQRMYRNKSEIIASLRQVDDASEVGEYVDLNRLRAFGERLTKARSLDDEKNLAFHHASQLIHTLRSQPNLRRCA